MDALILTLGHNSSAIYVKDGSIVFGIEEERLSAIKSDSSFPRKAIRHIQKNFDIYSFDAVYIGHWFINGKLEDSKYYDRGFVVDLLKTNQKHNVFAVNGRFTHHDSHNWSAIAFAEGQNVNFGKRTMSVVADGFGTFGEVISIYDVTLKVPKLIKRFYGFDASVGLFYQYSTLFQGMKMHNHEYKMLGYEAKIRDMFDEDFVMALDSSIESVSQSMINSLDAGTMNERDMLVDINALENTKTETHKLLTKILADNHAINFPEDTKRVVTSYITQKITENIMLHVVSPYLDQGDFEQVLFSGGVFYNVKLNKLLTELCPKVCFMPLAGDQGAGLGVYQYYAGDLQFPDNLFWAKRFLDVENFSCYNNETSHEGRFIIAKNEQDAYEYIFDELASSGYVNVVGPAMEFGPRSLGNTATIALPHKRVVDIINRMNDRTTVMPMAPMMTQSQADLYCPTTDKVLGSDKYMIVTHDVTKQGVARMPGAVNYYPCFSGQPSYTCRPQIVEKGLFYELCKNIGPLINTSFNYHGVPIVYTDEQIIDSHDKQNCRAPINTIIILG